MSTKGMDHIYPLKIERIVKGGSQDDKSYTEAKPTEDALVTKGILIPVDENYKTEVINQGVRADTEGNLTFFDRFSDEVKLKDIKRVNLDIGSYPFGEFIPNIWMEANHTSDVEVGNGIANATVVNMDAILNESDIKGLVLDSGGIKANRDNEFYASYSITSGVTKNTRSESSAYFEILRLDGTVETLTYTSRAMYHRTTAQNSSSASCRTRIDLYAGDTLFLKSYGTTSGIVVEGANIVLDLVNQYDSKTDFLLDLGEAISSDINKDTIAEYDGGEV